MAKPDDKADLQALRNLISEDHLIVDSTGLPQGRSARACELLSAAIILTDELLAVPPAAALGQRGGKKTAERGPDYFRKITGMRMTRAGSRPVKGNGYGSVRPIAKLGIVLVA